MECDKKKNTFEFFKCYEGKSVNKSQTDIG
jgi:hypothetical protein